ncbi:dehydrogenase/reductase SDR family member 9-like [Argiope bruennichi]|uniref:dehydrogenase/reductase SDR family member 9-like n=1 Tax=Argiope bruennichi TaxID=94029 RepID=UPI0024940628|nr:dehydrogenase/reductase SDR family member 9-like [Argiope bruennichi]
MSQVPLVQYAWRLIYFPAAALFFSSAALISIIVDLIKKLILKNKVLPHGRAVFVTGCDSGFGNALAKRLDSKGFHVFATCLFPTGPGATELKASCSNRLHVLYMDVTKDESVEKALEYVKAYLGSSELWAIVNNAGIFKGFSMEMSTLDDFKDVFDVNLMGVVRVTKAFLPLLKKSKGRIVNVTSLGGKIPFPFLAAYSSSKYAAVGLTDCLRHEVGMQGITVVSIEPEFFYTPMLYVSALGQLNSMGSQGSSFEDDHDDFKKSFKDLSNVATSFACLDTSIVVDDLEAAVSLVHPDHTYKPRRHALLRFSCFCYEKMPISFQILSIKSILFIFFSESKTLKNIVMKILSIKRK